MKNDRGFLCCLPSTIAPILVGLANIPFVIIFLALSPIMAIAPITVLLCIVWSFCKRESSTARLVLLIAYSIEAFAIWAFYAWAITSINSSNCEHNVTCRDNAKLFWGFTGVYGLVQFFLFYALLRYYKVTQEDAEVYQRL